MNMPQCGMPVGPAHEEQLPYVIINLSDDIVVERIQVSNQEDFSATLKLIHVEGSIDYPTSSWYSLGYIHNMSTILEPEGDKQIRYLKMTLQGPNDQQNSYCTLTNIRVFGNSMNYVMRNALHELSNE